MTASIHRTLERFIKLLATLDDKRIDWRGRSDIHEELVELMRLLDHVLPVWTIQSIGQHAIIGKITEGTEKLRGLIQ